MPDDVLARRMPPDEAARYEVLVRETQRLAAELAATKQAAVDMLTERDVEIAALRHLLGLNSGLFDARKPKPRTMG